MANRKTARQLAQHLLDEVTHLMQNNAALALENDELRRTIADLEAGTYDRNGVLLDATDEEEG